MSTSEPVLVPFFEKKDKFVFEQDSSSEVGNINFHENVPKKENIKLNGPFTKSQKIEII